MSKKQELQHNIPFTCACAIYLISSLWAREQIYLITLLSRQKIESNKGGKKGRELIPPQCLLPQIQELTWKRSAQVIRLELKASLSLLLMTWTLHAGSVKGRKENHITICTNTHTLVNLNLNSNYFKGKMC